MIISNKKYACETCIKGHRSSACRHTDRPLFEIKKKGRPVTQCEHCRELRKTKQVHVKCICEPGKADPPKSGSKQDFESAAFPNGLPESLGASVAFPSAAEGHSSDSDHCGIHGCKSGDPCPCISPRNKNRKKSAPDAAVLPSQTPGSASSSSLRSSSQIMARIAELRPVLPRPLPGDAPGGPIASSHRPTAQQQGHVPRHNDNAFSPYERAYGMTHQPVAHPQSYPASPTSLNPQYALHSQPFARQHQVTNTPWPAASGNPIEFPLGCECGDGCQCPGCAQHNSQISTPTSSAYLTCTNPQACLSCMDCTIMSLPLPTNLPADTSLSLYENSDAVDEWLRQLTSDPSGNQYDSMPVDHYPSLQNWGADATSQNRRAPSPMSNFMARTLPPSSSTSQGRQAFYPDQNARMRMQMDPALIDPRLLPESTMQLDALTAFSRSRSPSASSQSSHQGSQDAHHSVSTPYRPSGRIQGPFNPDSLSASGTRLQVRPGQNRGGAASRNSPSSISSSPSPGDPNASPSDPSFSNLRIF